MAEEKKASKPAAKKAAPKKKAMDLSLHELNKMAIEGHNKRMGETTSYVRRQRHPGRGQR